MSFLEFLTGTKAICSAAVALINPSLLVSLFFDGRKDRTLGIEKKCGITKTAVIVEEYISVCSGKGRYYFHFTPGSGTRDIYLLFQIKLQLSWFPGGWKMELTSLLWLWELTSIKI